MKGEIKSVNNWESEFERDGEDGDVLSYLEVAQGSFLLLEKLLNDRFLHDEFGQ